MTALATISDVEKYLGVNFDSSTNLEQLQYLIDSVSAEMRRITNRFLTAKDYDTDFDIDGNEVILEDYPIQSITSVSTGSPFGGTARTAVESTAYTTYDNIGILRLQSTIRRQEQYVNVVYNAGYESVIVDEEETNQDLIYLNSVCVKQVVDDLQETNVDVTESNDIKTEKFGDQTTTWFSDGEKSSTTRIENLRNSLSGYIRSVY